MEEVTIVISCNRRGPERRMKGLKSAEERYYHL